MNQVTLHGEKVSLEGKLQQIGGKLEDATLVGGDLAEVQLKDIAGDIKLILTVPSVDTDVCANEIRKINQWLSEWGKKGNVTALMISGDLPFAQKRFFDQHKIDQIIPYSQFRDQTFSRHLGVAIAGGPLRGLSARSVIITKRTGEGEVLQYVELVAEITAEPNYQAARQALENMV